MKKLLKLLRTREWCKRAKSQIKLKGCKDQLHMYIISYLVFLFIYTTIIQIYSIARFNFFYSSYCAAPCQCLLHPLADFTYLPVFFLSNFPFCSPAALWEWNHFNFNCEVFTRDLFIHLKQRFIKDILKIDIISLHTDFISKLYWIEQHFQWGI